MGRCHLFRRALRSNFRFALGFLSFAGDFLAAGVKETHLRRQVLSVQRLGKRYGETFAVDDLSFQVSRNEIVGLLGPNGAGKTTTINMILGVLEPTSGGVEIEGINLAKHRSEAI